MAKEFTFGGDPAAASEAAPETEADAGTEEVVSDLFETEAAESGDGAGEDGAAGGGDEDAGGDTDDADPQSSDLFTKPAKPRTVPYTRLSESREEVRDLKGQLSTAEETIKAMTEDHDASAAVSWQVAESYVDFDTEAVPKQIAFDAAFMSQLDKLSETTPAVAQVVRLVQAKMKEAGAVVPIREKNIVPEKTESAAKTDDKPTSEETPKALQAMLNREVNKDVAAALEDVKAPFVRQVAKSIIDSKGADAANLTRDEIRDAARDFFTGEGYKAADVLKPADPKSDEAEDGKPPGTGASAGAAAKDGPDPAATDDKVDAKPETREQLVKRRQNTMRTALTDAGLS